MCNDMIALRLHPSLSFFLLLLLLFFNFLLSLSSSGAFCDDSEDEYRRRSFPLHIPRRHLPWIWDAVYDPSLRLDYPTNENHINYKGLVEIISVVRQGCSFNHTKWREAYLLFPEVADQLAYGKKSNILVNSDSKLYDDLDIIYTDVGLLGEQMECIFYNSMKKEVFRSLSLVITGDQIYVQVSTIRIRCPSPSRERYPWTMMRLKRNMTRILNYQKKQLRKSRTTHHNNFNIEFNADTESETDMFPVCILSHPVPTWAKNNFTICTASHRGQRDHLVEWIEYHKLLGVDHFVMYDTSTNLKGSRLADILSDYVKEKVVTVVSWPYQNCVRNMASGHLTWWYPHFPNTRRVETFRPPRAISQTAALDSCYARYRSRSKYIGHIDEDEFYAFARYRNNTEWAPNVKTLTALAESLFEKYPNKSAIRFHPVCFYQCSPPIKNHVILPRIDTWYQGKLFNDYESKMIMRTDAVIQYFVHYVIDVENRNGWQHDPNSYITPSPKHAILFHYKDQGSIWGNRIPLSNKNNSLRSHQCDANKLSELNFVDTSTGTGKVLHHIPKYIVDLLEMKFTQRMNKN